MGAALGLDARDVGAVSSQNWCSRMLSSVGGMFVGVVLFFCSIGLLGWNEFNYVRNVSVFYYVKEHAFDYPDCHPVPQAEGPVHLSCPLAELYDFASNDLGGRLQFDDKASPSGQLLGLWFGASSHIYQWQETETCTSKTNSVGTKVTTCNYYYHKAWTTSPQSSSQFYCLRNSMTAEGCPGGPGRIGESTTLPENSGSIPQVLHGIHLPRDYSITVGNASSFFRLNSGLLTGEPFGRRPVTLKPAVKQTPPSGLDSGLKVYVIDDEVYFASADPAVAHPNIGDIRTNFFVSDVQANGSSYFSVVAQQSGLINLQPWETGKKGTMHSVNWGAAGRMSLDDMLDYQARANSQATSFLRFAGWATMFVALQLFTGPIALAPEIVPCVGSFLGSIVGCVLCAMNCLISLSLSIMVIAVAWTLARPVVGLTLFAASFIALSAAAWLRSRHWKPSRPEASDDGVEFS
mmetsp:Transcript_29697/g.78806  ORF Transcript_29697/g.78806 Transcript_29697/m.78806 type:complete len:462 (-) Transcript_29697:87-1472(-)